MCLWDKQGSIWEQSKCPLFWEKFKFVFPLRSLNKTLYIEMFSQIY